MSIIHYFWPNTRLPAPLNPQAIVLSGTSIRVTVSAVAYATGYRLAYRQLSTDPFSSNGLTYTTTQIDVTGLTSGLQYEFVVFAVGDGNPYTSGFFSVSCFATPGSSTIQLAAPTNPLATTINGNTLSLTASSVANATGYKLYRSATTNGSYALITAILATPSYSDSGLSASTTYFYGWVAVGDGTTYADSALGAAFSGTTAPNPTVSNASFTPA